MKKTIILSLLLYCVTIFSYAQQLAFPGAEGWGRFATGGRATDPFVGSNVYYVTRLDDCADNALVEGTLRWALNTGDATPRTILFKVGGTINLTSKLRFGFPNVSILGQSAPGGGICVSGANIYVNKSNVIIRYVRFRAGDLASSNYAALDIENVSNVIIDHCSFSWSMEENVTMYDNKNTTMQWCILSEPLYYSRHQKGQRGYGAQWGGENSSYHHNLFAHCVSRIPRVNGVRSTGTTGHDFHVDSELTNNVMYNCGGSESLYGGEVMAPDLADAYCRTNLINNYFKSGPATKAKSSSGRYFAVIYHNKSGTSTAPAQWYINGNAFESNSYDPRDMSDVNTDNWQYAGLNNPDSKRAVNFNSSPTAPYTLSDFKLSSPSASSGIATTNASSAYSDVLAKVGARLPVLDEVDGRILAEAAGLQDPVFKGAYAPTYIGVIDSQNDLKPASADATWNAWPDLSAFSDESAIVDTDGDGMPDQYELDNGFNPTDPTDGVAIAVNGYSNLENYLNGLLNATVIAPYNLTAKYNEVTGKVDLKWIDASDNETGFILERALASDGIFAEVAQLGANATSYSDDGIDTSKKYIYRLKSIDGSTESVAVRTALYPVSQSSISENKIEGLKVYPNPVVNDLNIESEEQISQIEIFDLSGRLIQHNTINENKVSISMQHYPKGIYSAVVKAASGNQSVVKVVK